MSDFRERYEKESPRVRSAALLFILYSVVDGMPAKWLEDKKLMKSWIMMVQGNIFTPEELDAGLKLATDSAKAILEEEQKK
jgi:hypothetical protein